MALSHLGFLFHSIQTVCAPLHKRLGHAMMMVNADHSGDIVVQQQITVMTCPSGARSATEFAEGPRVRILLTADPGLVSAATGKTSVLPTGSGNLRVVNSVFAMVSML